jgi:hypothetical protein
VRILYFDLKFPYRISSEAGMAHDEDGNDTEAFLRIKIGGCKKEVTSEQYDEMHEEQRHSVASMLEKDVAWVIKITGEEYEANTDDEDD